jgi:histidyl-tRNA synthetase
VLDGVLESIGLGGEANAARRLTVLRAVDKYDRLGIEGVRQLLGAGRKDDSGDFTKGAELTTEQISEVLQNIVSGAAGDIGPTGAVMSVVKAPHGKIPPGENLRVGALSELFEIQKLVRAAGYDSDRILIDPSVVRGLEYYTGPVYEVDLTFETKDDRGRPLRFGSVGGGGRYDGLIARFRGEPVPATGFSIGVSRLAAALQHLGKIASTPEPGPVVVTVFDQQRISDYQNMVAKLRNAGVRAELYLGSGKMAAQLKYADKRGAPCVVIQGGDEKAKGEVQIKDLIEGAKASAAIASHEEWRERRPAQFAVAEEKLVESVREVLARHGVTWS